MADPTDTIADDPEELRTALVDQLQYLIDEVEVLKDVIDRVPESVRTGRPLPDMLTLKEIYGVIAAKDAEVHLPRLRAVVDGEQAPSFEPVPDEDFAEAEPWNDRPMDAILERLQAARRELVAFLDDLSPAAWRKTGTFDGETRTVYDTAYRIMQADTERLRTVGHRLHESNLTGRERDLPK